ncbi:MAG: hypothetical protein IKE70_02260 [Bacilli bacterium]|nr:hypothetical protein [Bacilli bacterium]
MNRLKKCMILLGMSLSVFFIYQKTYHSKIKLLVIGDYLSTSKNHNSYLDFFEEKISNNIKINKKYIKENLTIHEVLLLIKNNSSLKKDLLESHILILNLGLNDYLYQSTLKKNQMIKNNPIEEVEKELKELIAEIEKYYKETIYIIEYPKLDKTNKKINLILKEQDVSFVEINSNKIENWEEQISQELKKTLEKDQII